MKVHIAYDDGELIGVYRTNAVARVALTLQAAKVKRRVKSKGLTFTDWADTSTGVDRHVISADTPHKWDQWIDTHKVKP